LQRPTYFHHIALTFVLIPDIADRYENLDVDGFALFAASAGCDTFVGFAGSAFEPYFLVADIFAAAGSLSIGANLFAEFE